MLIGPGQRNQYQKQKPILRKTRALQSHPYLLSVGDYSIGDFNL